MIELETLPKGWTIAKLGDICFTTSGGTPSRKMPNYYGGNIPWVKSGELDKGLILDTEEKITEEAIKNSSAKVFPKGTLLIALYGATVGKLAFLGIDATTNQAICGIYKSEAIESKLLYYFLLLQKSNLVSQSIGGAQPNISQGIIKDLIIPLAPLNEQKRILAKLEQLLTDLDKGIEYLETTKQQLKVYRQAVLKWAFEGKLTNKHVKENELPKGWKWSPISDVISELNQGWSPKCENTNSTSNDEWAVIKTSAIQHINFEELENKRLPKHLIPRKQHELKNNDILITRAGPRIRVGVCCLVKNVRPKLLNCDKAYRIIADESKVLPVYLVQVLNTPRFLKIIDKCKTGGSDSGLNLTQTRFTSIEIPLPKDIEEQRRIISEIESRLSVCDKIEETIESSLQQAEALRLSIIKKAFEGKLVPQDPNDEPAEKLLERIRAEKGNGKPKKKEKVKAEKEVKTKSKKVAVSES